MLRALLWKEWRELRLLRLAGLALGVVLPVAFLLGAEAFRRGLSPFGKSGGYTLEELFFSLLPSALAFALWPLLALLTVAQAFCADRASGREGFLLERPVGRGRVFSARLLASLGSVLVIVVGTAAVGGVLARLTTAPGQDWAVPLQVLAAGLAITFVVLLAGLGASPLLQSPMAAVLLAILLAGIPFLLGAQLAGFFPLATAFGVPVGLLLPCLLLPAYALAAWRGLCRGEPAGRGRARRALVVLSIAVLAVLLSFPALATAALRWGGSVRLFEGWITPAPRSEAAVITMGGHMARAWIVDVTTGDRTRFLAPPVSQVAWKVDGSVVATVTAAGHFGGLSPNLRIEFHDPAGAEAFPAVVLPEERWISQIVWAGEVLLVTTNPAGTARGRAELLFVRPGDGTRRSATIPGDAYGAWIEGPTDGGEVFVRNLVLAPATPESERGTHSMFRVDAANGTIAERPTVPDFGAGGGRFGGISPSGRFWLWVERGDEPREARAVELATGTAVEPSLNGTGAWLAGDRLIWMERKEGDVRVLVARPGEAPRTIGTWTRVFAHLERSPTKDAVLLTVVTAEPNPTTSVWIYEASTDRMTQVPTRERYPQVLWAGSRTLAFRGNGWIALEDVGKPESRRFVFGRP